MVKHVTTGWVFVVLFLQLFYKFEFFQNKDCSGEGRQDYRYKLYFRQLSSGRDKVLYRRITVNK